MNSILRALCIFILSMAFCACYHDSGKEILALAEEQMDNDPDSVYKMLTAQDTRKMDKPTLMHRQLLLAQAQNKAVVDFTSDSTMTEVVLYYDHHGTPNQRMLAHYLLGCVYRDLGEVPRAIDCYQTAIDCADTLSLTMDAKTLSCIYSQMAELYHRQLLLSEELRCRERSMRLSYQIGDTLNAAYDLYSAAGALMLLNQRDTAERALLKCKEMYPRQDWLDISITLIAMYVEDKGRQQDAKRLMDEFEAESEWFDSHHELPPSKRQYYYYKGCYYENAGQLDSAEYYYRKTAKPHMNYVSQNPMYHGLLRVYQQKHLSDSIAKYAQLYCQVNDSSIAISDREITAQMAAMYQYTRLQRMAAQKHMQAKKAQSRFLLSTLGLILLSVFLVCLYLHYQKKRREKEEETNRLANELAQTRAEYEDKQQAILQLESARKELTALIQQKLVASESNAQTRQELQLQLQEQISEINARHQEALNVYAKEVERLNGKIKSLCATSNVITSKLYTATNFQSSDIVNRINNLAGNSLARMGDKDWASLTKAFAQTYPTLIRDLQQSAHLSQQGLQACLLVALKLRTDDIANLMGISKQRVANLKSEVNDALFGDSSARSLYSNLEQAYNIFHII